MSQGYWTFNNKNAPKQNFQKSFLRKNDRKYFIMNLFINVLLDISKPDEIC